jgi:hypothetical protein
MTTITGQQSVDLTVASGPTLQYDSEAFSSLVDDGIEAKSFVALNIQNSLGETVTLSVAHTTGAGKNIQVQPVGTWTLTLAGGGSSVRPSIQGGTSGTQQLQLSSRGAFQYLDSTNTWQPLTSSTSLPAAQTFVIANDSSSSLSVTGQQTIASQSTATVGVAAPGPGNQKSLALTVTSSTGSHDPTFVIKSASGGTVVE